MSRLRIDCVVGARPNFIKVFPHEYKRVLGVERAETTYSTPNSTSPLVGATEVKNG